MTLFRFSLFTLLSCQDKHSDHADSEAHSGGNDTEQTEPNEDSDTPDSDTEDSDTEDTVQEVFTLSLPAATDSTGHPLSDECAYLLDVSYECENPNPELIWENAPSGTVGFVLIFDDPDARNYPHWSVVNLPPSATGIAPGISGQGLSPDLGEEAYELENGFGFTGYLGSCPPSAHVYRWRVWAVSEMLPPNLSNFKDVEAAAEAAALGMAETCHIYGPRS